MRRYVILYISQLKGKKPTKSLNVLDLSSKKGNKKNSITSSAKNAIIIFDFIQPRLIETL